MKQEPRPIGRVPASSFLQVKIRGFPKNESCVNAKSVVSVSLFRCFNLLEFSFGQQHADRFFKNTMPFSHKAREKASAFALYS